MDPNTEPRKNRLLKVAIPVIILLLLAGLAGWGLGRTNSHNDTKAQQTSNQTQPQQQTGTADVKEVKALITYTLPDGAKEGTCPSAASTVYVIPSGADLNCDANPSAPIKISVDPQGATDCNQLQNVQNVKKHICSSMAIDGHKTLKSSTEQSNGETTDAYYIDTGKGVVKIEYIHQSSNNQYQSDFDRLANNIKVKS
ncbi:MAG: hypothetical protein JWL85_903 [Candidatus Saccharibacteria bacterium]|nr:hypothetical protein [Candidatus Saccharibacteria bacterium]